MKMLLKVFPPHIVEQYKLDQHANNGFVYLELRNTIYGLPQAGILANKQLKARLAPLGYYKVTHMPGLWQHATKPVQFTLVVHDLA